MKQATTMIIINKQPSATFSNGITGGDSNNDGKMKKKIFVVETTKLHV
jgi:hypothetical protein